MKKFVVHNNYSLNGGFNDGEKSIATNYGGQHNDVEDVATTDISNGRVEQESARAKA